MLACGSVPRFLPSVLRRLFSPGPLAPHLLPEFPPGALIMVSLLWRVLLLCWTASQWWWLWWSRSQQGKYLGWYPGTGSHGQGLRVSQASWLDLLVFMRPSATNLRSLSLNFLNHQMRVVVFTFGIFAMETCRKLLIDIFFPPALGHTTYNPRAGGSVQYNLWSYGQFETSLGFTWDPVSKRSKTHPTPN